jgi:DnaD/phage-associated family protein
VTIIRCLHDEAHPAVEVVRTTAQNKALSYEALGMLTYLLSQADDWVVGVDDLMRDGCGRDKAYRILRELTDAGHLKHVRSDAKQHLPPVWGERTVYEQPFTEKPDMVTPVPEIPELVKSGNGEPVPEKPDTVKPSVTHVSADAGKSFKALNAQEQLQVLKDKSDAEDDKPRAKVFDQYTALTKHGIDSEIVAQQLLADVEDFGQEWIDEAVAKAALNGVTNWNYVRKMLRTWKRDGREESRPAKVTTPLPRGSPASNGAHAPPSTPIPVTSPGAPRLSRKD